MGYHEDGREGGEEEEGRRRGGGGGAGEPQKVRTPHKDVGKNDNHSENSEIF